MSREHKRDFGGSKRTPANIQKSPVSNYGGEEDNRRKLVINKRGEAKSKRRAEENKRSGVKNEGIRGRLRKWLGYRIGRGYGKNR